MDNIMLYTDGACSGNPGPGGYCAILKMGEHVKYISGSQKQTTNNRMELTAVIEGLKALKRPCEVTVISDSKYVCDAINQKWIYGWKKKDGKKATINLYLILSCGRNFMTYYRYTMSLFNG